MLEFFRRFTKSRYGLIAVFIFLGVIALAFAAGDVSGIRAMGGASSGSDTVARVGSTKISAAEVRERVDRFLRSLQREGQNVTMEQFLAQGGLELALDEMINSAALVEFAQKSGMQVSKKLVDTEIANNPSFLGFDGKFSQKTFEDLLSQNRFSPAAYREGLEHDRYGNWLVNRATLGNQIPRGVILPYASLLLERRVGTVGLVPTVGMDPGPDPDDKTLNAFYTSHRGVYTIPPRRIVRYAQVQPEAIKAQMAATDAEIADAYAKAGARFAATEKRDVRQLIVLDQATANKVAAEVKSGKTLAAVASAQGLTPIAFTGVEKNALARQTSAALGDAAFGAAQGAMVGPIRSQLGWHVLVVEKVEKVAAKTLAQAHQELADEITQRKTAQKLIETRQAIEDGIGNGKTFDEAIRDAKLTAVSTPALTAQGTNPDDPAYKPDPALAPIMRAGFQLQQGDDPQVVPTSQEGAFAVVALEKAIPATPRPLASIKEQVKKDYLLDKALELARKTAMDIIARIEKGTPIAQAFAEAGVKKAPPLKPFDYVRQDLLGKPMAESIRLAFTMAPKKAKFVAAEGRAGYYVVYLDQAEQHDASNNPAAIARVTGDITPQVGAEYAREFVRAIRNDVKVTRDEAAIKRLRDDLARTGTSGS